MATKKAVSTGKKSSAKKTTVKTVSPTSNVTTVKAVSTSTTAGSFISDGLNISPLLAAMIAEFIGTFLLAAAYIDLQGSPLYVAFVVTGIVLLIGGLSGAHINPAVTIGAWFTRKIRASRAIAYIVAQILGAMAAFAVLSGFAKATATDSTSATALYHAASVISGKEWYLFFAELLGTTVIAFAVATTLRNRRDRLTQSFTIGFGVLVGLALAVSATAPLLSAASTGFTILNPAVAISLSALNWDGWVLAIYILAPILGGIIGFLLQGILKSQAETENI